jgi:PAS domain S-box-containing protein
MPNGAIQTSPLPFLDEAEAERLRRACVASGVGIYEFDIDRLEGVWGIGIGEILGFDAPQMAVDFGMIASRVHPEERDASLRRMQDAMARPGPYDMRHKLLRSDGRAIWVRDRGCVYVDPDAEGRPKRRAVGTLIDTTAEVEAQERLNTIAGEMQHRLKNHLAVVASLVRLMRPGPIEEFRAELIGRLRSLAASQTLANETIGGVDLRALCRSQLAPAWDDLDRRLTLSGPTAVVRSDVAEAIGMALYELLTNAMKHGALSNERGTVSVSWSREGSRFRMVWREDGGRPSGDAAEPGFGTHIIRDFVAAALGGRVDVETSEEGLIWSLDAPAADVLTA